MFKRVNRLMIVMVAAVLIAACAPAPPPPPDTTADEATLKADLTRWMDDVNAGNIEAVVAQYAPDAVLMPPNAPAATGTAAIRKELESQAAGMKAASLKIRVTGTPSLGVKDDFAWIQGAYEVTAANGTAVDVGKFLSVHKKTNGAWLYIRDTWNSDMPPPPPPPAKK